MFSMVFPVIPLDSSHFSHGFVSAVRDRDGLPGRCESTVAFRHPSARATQKSRRNWREDEAFVVETQKDRGPIARPTIRWKI
jgi:hypothetical protein